MERNNVKSKDMKTALHKSAHNGVLYKTFTDGNKRYLGVYIDNINVHCIDIPLHSVRDMMRYLDAKIKDYGGWSAEIYNDLTKDTYINKNGLLELDWIDVERIRKKLSEGSADNWVQCLERTILANV